MRHIVGSGLRSGRGPARVVESTPAAQVFSDGYANGDTFGLVGDESFNSASPTLKDGTAMSGDMLTYHDAAAYAHLNANATSGDWQYVNLPHYLGNASTYNSARFGQTTLLSLLMLFRLTGDLRLLDRLKVAWDAAKPVATTAWSGHDCAAIDAEYTTCPVSTGDPWSPYAKFLNYQSGFRYGTDLLSIDTFKHASMMAESAWAFWVNRSKTSPAGYDYAAEATYWIDKVEDFVLTWHETAVAGTWTDNYKGHEWYASGRERNPWGAYPIVSDTGGHTSIQIWPLHHYVGLLGEHAGANIPSPTDARTWVRTFVTDIHDALIPCSVGPWGDNMIMLGKATTDRDATYDTPHGATYTKYSGHNFVDMWMTGRYRDIFDQATMRKMALAWADMHFADGSTYHNLAGSSDKSSCGVADGGTTAGGITRTQQAWGGQAIMLVMEDRTTTTRLKDAAVSVQNDIAGGFTTPDSMKLPTALFLYEALHSVGDLA